MLRRWEKTDPRAVARMQAIYRALHGEPVMCEGVSSVVARLVLRDFSRVRWGSRSFLLSPTLKPLHPTPRTTERARGGRRFAGVHPTRPPGCTVCSP